MNDPKNKSQEADDLAGTIRRLRKERDLTQAELGAAAGVDESYISKIESRRLSYTPSQETLRLIAAELRVSPLLLLALAQKTPEELGPAATSRPAHEFFELVNQGRLSDEDWTDLARRLRYRLSKRGRTR